MTATRKGDPTLFSATAGRTNGVFTAEVKWKLQVEITTNLLHMLPTSVAAAFAADLPFEGNEFPGVPLASCRGVKCDLTEDNGVYIFTANYSDENATEKDKATDDNPLLDLPKIKPIAGMTSEAMTKDRDGFAILNSAGDPIIQSRESNTIGFRITANIDAVPAIALLLRDTVNDAEITVAGLPIAEEVARYILPSDWLSLRKNRNNIGYYEFSYELMLDERDQHKGWPLDAGFRVLKAVSDGNGGLVDRPVAITEDDGSEPSEPVPLDGNGNRLDGPTPSTAIYRETGKHPLADYSVLPGVS